MSQRPNPSSEAVQPANGKWEVRSGLTEVRLLPARVEQALLSLLAIEALLFGALATLVWHTSKADGFEKSLARAVYARPGTVPRSAASLLSTLGAPGAALIGGALVAAWAWRRFRDPVLAAFGPASVAVAAVVETVMKKVVARPRPPTALLAHEFGYSFPSGHATAAAALAAAAILLVLAGGGRRRWLAVAAATFYAVLISATRLVLGVHYLSDVVGGTLVGVAVVLVAGWGCAQLARNRRS